MVKACLLQRLVCAQVQRKPAHAATTKPGAASFEDGTAAEASRTNVKK
jgi:hypothetical protein